MAKVSLKEDRYGEKLLKTLNVLRKERKYSDFYIETNSGLVPVHRVVLAAAESCHLKSKGFLCGDINTFDLTEFNKNVVEIFVSYLYTGEVDLTGDSDIKDFVNLCKKLEFKTLLNHKEFQKPNSNEVSKKHNNELFEEDTVNSQDSDSEPHPVYLATNRDGQMFVKSVPTIHCNDNQNTNISNTSKLPESTEGRLLQEFIIKEEPNSDDDSDNELDSIETESSLTQSNKLKQKRPNKKSLKGKNKKLKSTTESVKQYAEQLVSKVVGMGEGGGDIEEDSGDNDDALGDNEDEVGDADDQELEESQNDFVIKEEQDSAVRKRNHQEASNIDQLDTGTEGTTKKKLKCNDCDFTTPWRSSLCRHRRIHDQNMFYCDQCDSRFPDLCMLKIHTKHKHGEGLICSHCSKKFTSIGGLKYHMKKISGQFRRKCTYCEKTFISTQHYESHVNKHKNIKPFKCDICQKAFLYKIYLTQHIEKCHTENHEQRIFKCDVCDIELTSKSALRSHMVGKHGNSVRVCRTCGKSFNWAASYYRHIKTHV